MFFGWRVVGSAFLLTVWSSGLGLYSLSIFLMALQRQHGWSASTISFAITGYYLLSALLMSGMGGAVRRFGPRATVLTGIGAMALGVYALTGVTAVWQLHLAFAAMALGWATTSSAAVNILLAPWFDQRRGLAVSLALTGAPVGGIVVAPALLALVESTGFRMGVGITLLGALAAVLPAAVLTFGRTPAGLGRMPEGGPSPGQHTAGLGTAALSMPAALNARVTTAGGRREALRTLCYWTLSLAFAAALAAQIGTLSHIAAYLAPVRGAAGAAAALSVITASALAGRLVLGVFVDRLPLRALSSAVFLAQAAGLALVTRDAAPALYAGCMLFGLGVGSVVTLPGLLVQREFPAAHFAEIVSLVAATNQVGFAFGPSVVGVLRDLTGGYTVALELAGGMDLFAAMLILLGGRAGNVAPGKAD
jgi:MFS family permease